MALHTYRACYRTLGISTDCGWDELRLAFRRRVHRCHPDLIPQRPGIELANREEEFKRVVRAYRLLADYRRHYGALPPPHLPLLAPANGDWRQRMPARQTPSRRADRARRAWLRERPFMSRFHQVFIASFLLAVGTLAALEAGSERAWRRPHHVRPDTYLTVGMDSAEVVGVQGVPNYTKGSVWFYGKSGVIFEKGCVIGWENLPPFPLRTLAPTVYLTRYIDAVPARVRVERIECTLPE